MRRGHGLGEKYSADPIGSDSPRGKNREHRKAARDGTSWTVTEEHLRNKFLRQFMKNPDGSEHRDVDAYKASPVWCRGCNGRRMAIDDGYCHDCYGRALE